LLTEERHTSISNYTHRKYCEIGDVLGDGLTLSYQPPGQNPEIGDFSYWTLGGFFVAAKSLFSANATYTFEDAIGILVEFPDTLST
jgi:hypothetical protein